MQTSETEKKICQIHRLDVVAVDPQKQTKPEDKYLCTRCLTDKVDKENMALLTEANEMIQSMRTESLKLSKEENTLRLQNLKQLQLLIKSFKNYIKMELGKLLNLLQQQIEQIQNDIESKDLKMEIKKFDEEIQILSENYIGHFIYNIPIEKTCKQKDIELIQLIQESLQSQSKSYYFSEIMESRDKIKQNLPIVKQANINKMPVKEFDQHKTPCLNQTCNKHNQEIIMFNFNLEVSDVSRLACVECIKKNPIQYISLKEANKRWKLFVGRQKDLIDKHNLKRQNTFSMVVKEVKQLRDYYNDQLSEILISMDEQLKKNNQDIQEIINLENKSLIELDEQSIVKIIQFLILRIKINAQFIKHDLLCKQQLIKICQEQNDNQETKRNVQQDSQTSPEIHEFISKCQLQEQYMAIFNESVDLQLELQKDAKVLQQKGELNKFEDCDNLETVMCSQIQQQYKQFEINSEKMRKQMMAEENEEQLKVITQKNEELQIKIQDEMQEIKQIQQKKPQIQTRAYKHKYQQRMKKLQNKTEQFNQEIISKNQIKLNLEEFTKSSQQIAQELRDKQDEMNQQIDGIQQGLENVKKPTILDDKLQSLQQSLSSKLNQSVEQLNSTITEKVTQLEKQSQELKKEAASKKQFDDLELQLKKVDKQVQENTEILVEYEVNLFKNNIQHFYQQSQQKERKMEFIKKHFLLLKRDQLIYQREISSIKYHKIQNQ